MAGRIWWYWWEPKGAAPAFIPPPLQLSEFVTAGRGVIEILALFEADPDASGTLWTAGSRGQLLDPASDVELDTPAITLSQIVRQSATQLTFDRNAGSGWNSAFEGTGLFVDGTVYVQTRHGLVVLPVATTLADAGFGFMRYNVPAGMRALLNNIGMGDRFIVAMARPEVADRVGWNTDRILWGPDRVLWAA